MSPQNKAASTSPNTSSKASVFIIPPELRLEIYEHYLADLDIGSGISVRRRNMLKPALLNTCQLIRKEALTLYMKSLEVKRRIEGTQFDEQWSASMKEYSAEGDSRKAWQIIQRVRRVEMEWEDRNKLYAEEMERIRKY